MSEETKLEAILDGRIAEIRRTMLTQSLAVWVLFFVQTEENLMKLIAF